MAKERHREKERKRDRKGETLNHLSIHQWVRSAILASHQLTSPIGFHFWNFRHRLVRYYWYIYVEWVYTGENVPLWILKLFSISMRAVSNLWIKISGLGNGFLSENCVLSERRNTRSETRVWNRSFWRAGSNLGYCRRRNPNRGRCVACWIATGRPIACERVTDVMPACLQMFAGTKGGDG